MTDEKIKCLMHSVLGYEINDQMPNDYNSVVLRDVVYKTIVAAERIVAIEVLEKLAEEILVDGINENSIMFRIKTKLDELKAGQ